MSDNPSKKRGQPIGWRSEGTHTGNPPGAPPRWTIAGRPLPPAQVTAQVDDHDVTPGYWDRWPDRDSHGRQTETWADRSVELAFHAEDPVQPLGWCEGVGVIADPHADSITVVVVLPEGSISMTISRTETGRLILTTPDHEDEGTLPVYQLAPGTYQVRDAVRTEDLG